MPNVFSKPDKPLNPQLRNTFDLSFANNLTADIGELIPCFCKEVLPGDTFRINTTFGLRFMPTAFPLQSRIRADIHFFYVRNRNLWNGWQEFITNSPESGKQKPFPTINPENLANSVSKKAIAKTSSLGDYLGLPTTLSGKFGNLSSIARLNFATSPDISAGCPERPVLVQLGDYFPDDTISGRPGIGGSSMRAVQSFVGRVFPIDEMYSLSGSGNNTAVYWHDPDSLFKNARLFTVLGKNSFYLRIKKLPSVFSQCQTSCFVLGGKMQVLFEGYYMPHLDTPEWSYFFFPPLSDSLLSHLVSKGPFTIGFGCFRSSDKHERESVELSKLFNFEVFSGLNPQDSFSGELVFSVQPNTSTTGDFPYPRDLQETLELGFGNSPYDFVPVSALPFRAYESVYNAFYRDERNNPLIDDETHVQVYNRTLLNTDGGEDSFNYQIRYRNWEQDFLTTAMTTPQQGTAPLVGLTNGAVTFLDPDSGKQYSATPVFAEDGETLQTATFQDVDVPSSVARSLVQFASSGISINDFRNVNSLQRYLENNLRNGLRYIDNLKMRWGVNPSYATMDMPEFIGGVSQPVQVSQITQMSEGSSDSPLGSYAGQLSAIGSSKHSVTHHCDEHGFIIGILSVVPVPVYSTLLPKFFTKTSPLDYFTPEFGHIGLQPIPYREVAPVLVVNDPESSDEDARKNLSNTFGYQRPWYDYLASTDEVHGLFRTNLKDFLLHRVFDSVPHLDPSFLLINPDSLTDVFSVSVGGDKILGQVYFDVKAKRPIPRYCNPRLE